MPLRFVCSMLVHGKDQVIAYCPQIGVEAVEMERPSTINLGAATSALHEAVEHLLLA